MSSFIVNNKSGLKMNLSPGEEAVIEPTPEELAILQAEERKVVEELLSFDAKTRDNEILREDDFFPIGDLIDDKDIKHLPRVTVTVRDKKKMVLESDNTDILKRFHKSYPIFHNINMEGLFIAGGSVAGHILCPESADDHDYLCRKSDIDIFVCGYDSIDKAEDRIKDFIEELASKGKISRVTRSEHAITLRLRQQYGNIPVQIILRLYSSPSEVLHGFDLGSCMVGIWKGKVYTTRLGKFSFENRCNILNLPRRSTTYEKRLFKYMDRGFDIILSDLDTSKIVKENCFKVGLPNMTLDFYKGAFNRRYDTYKTADKDVNLSDYSVSGKAAISSINFTLLSKWKIGEPYPMFVRSFRSGNMHPRVVANEAFATTPVCADGSKCVNEHMLTWGYERIKLNRKGHIYANKCEMFIPHVSLDTIYKMVKNGESLTPLLEASKKENTEKVEYFNQNGNIPVKWIVTDPGTQLCGSFNPTVTTKEEWYGDFLKK